MQRGLVYLSEDWLLNIIFLNEVIPEIILFGLDIVHDFDKKN